MVSGENFESSDFRGSLERAFPKLGFWDEEDAITLPLKKNANSLIFFLNLCSIYII